MIRSVNEISSLVGKAARGAAVPTGVAEDLSQAIPEFCAQDEVAEALAALVRHLAQPVDLMVLIAALDRVEAEGCALALPLVIDPLLAALIRHRGGVGWQQSPEGCLLVAQDQPPVPGPRPQSLPPELWAKLEAFAARTYVPATEASRIAGAGAGLSDND